MNMGAMAWKAPINVEKLLEFKNSLHVGDYVEFERKISRGLDMHLSEEKRRISGRIKKLYSRTFILTNGQVCTYAEYMISKVS